MATNVPAECPSCAAGGIRSSVKLYQINLEEAAVFCENSTCPFPLFSQNVCPLVVSHAVASASAAKSPTTKLKTRSMDTDSMASSCSVSSWTSHASTASSISSNVATPPPIISSKPFSWPSNQQLVYQPKAVVPKQKNIFDWISPISSAQSSPTLSVFSANDQEVESVMKKSNYLPPNSGLTPSPSPLLSDLLDATESQPSNDTDVYIESFSFLMEGDASRSQTPTPNIPRTRDSSPNKLTELTSSKSLVEEAISTSEPIPLPESPEVVSEAKKQLNDASNKTPRQRRKKRTIELDTDDSSCERIEPCMMTPDSTPVWGNTELPSRKKSVSQVKKPQTPRVPQVKKSRPTVDTTSSDESTVSSAPAPAPTRSPNKNSLVAKPQVPQVALTVNADGTPIFTIHPITPSPSPKPHTTKKPSTPAVSPKPCTTNKPKTPSVNRTGRAKKTAVTPTPDPVAIAVPVSKKKNAKKEDPFCIESLVQKFIHQAKNKKIPDPKAT